MGSPAIYGYKASTYVATGGITTNEMRASVIEPKKTNGWIINFTARVGKAFAGNPTAQLDMAIYNAEGASATTFVGEASGTANVTAVMQNSSQGVNVSKAPALPIKRFANLPYALVIRSNLNHFNFGMNASGQRMGFKTASSFPSPYAHTSNNHNGRIGMWADEITNSPPKMPSNVSPIDGASINDTTPTLAADFRDDEEILPGFALGQCDRVKKFQFRILQGSTVVEDSTVLTADTTMRDNRRVTWTSPALDPGEYTAWCQVYDEFEEYSAIKTWTFTVETSTVTVALDPANVDATDPLRTISDTPGFTYSWDDDLGASMTFGQVQIRQEDTGTVVRGPQLFAAGIPDGGSDTEAGAAFFAAASWPDLALGERYRFEMQGYDGTNWSGFSAGEWFIVNFPPYAPNALDPVNGRGVTSRPFLSAAFYDADDESVDLAPEFYVRPAGDVSNGVLVSGSPVWLGSNRWGIQTTSTEVPSLGDYEWRARASDPVGGVGSYQVWHSFTYTDPPEITFTNPAAPEDPVLTSTPNLTWTVDRTQTSYRVRLYKTTYSIWIINSILAGLLGIPFVPPVDPIYDTGYVTSSAGSHTVKTGKLFNGDEYVWLHTVRTSDGLEAEDVTSFVVDYDERPALTGFSGALVQGPFESIPSHASSVDLNWDPLPTTAGGVNDPWAADGDFAGYIVRRENLDTGEVERMQRITGRNLNGFTDREWRSGFNYRWTVTYLYLHDGVEWVESDPVTFEHAGQLAALTLSDLETDGLSVPIFYWDDRALTRHTSTEVVATLGRLPITFQGELNYRTVSVSFHVVDDPHGAYTAVEHMEAIEAFASVTYDSPDEHPVPRNICLRTPTKVIAYGSLISPIVRNDDTDPAHISGTFTFVENATHIEEDV